MGGALLENWILEEDEQGNFSVNAFVFICIVFGLNFWAPSYKMNDRVNMLLRPGSDAELFMSRT